MAIIGDTNGFRAIAALREAAADRRVAEIEGGGCDEGCVLIHLKDGYVFSGYNSATKGVGSAADIKHALSIIIKSTGVSKT